MTFSYKMSMEAPLAFNSAERKGHTIVIIIIIVNRLFYSRDRGFIIVVISKSPDHTRTL